MSLAIALFLLVIATVVLHFVFAYYFDWWFTPLAADWAGIDLTVLITLWVTGFVFVAINAFMAYCVWRFRHKPGHKAVYEPENHKLEINLSIFTTVGVVLMLAPGLFYWAVFVNVPEDARDYEVMAQQWQWQYRYPGADGILGTADTSYISQSNPFGVNPEDPNGQDDVIVNDPQMRLPVDQDAHFLFRSNDVLHNFTVPQFRVKMDLVPGLISYMWFTPTEVGAYDVLCEELCGIGHFIMRGQVVVETEEDFNTWLAAQPTFAETQNMVAANPAAGQAQYALCATCHGQQGEGNLALNSPKLTGQPAWYIERQLQYFKTGVRGGEGDVFGLQMAPMAATLIDDEAVRNMAAYIASLPDAPAERTVTGDIANGQDIYDRNCAACHLDDGSGTWYTDAPPLAGQNDWYLVTQLSNFQSRVRGMHPDDTFGEQMVQMATAMADEEEIRDVAAYINTLSSSRIEVGE